MSDPFIGEIRIFGFDYAPLGWAFCNGQTLLITQNQALFAVLGVTFGGDGKTNFNLPNLMGRVPLCAGAGTGLTPRNAGAAVGADTVALSVEQMPWHTHALNAQNANAQQAGPANAFLAKGGHGDGKAFTAWNTYVPGPTTMPMSNQAVGVTGQGLAHENRQPVQILNYCIALQGIFPPKS
ncbi:MAG: phage tail protein [Candidatus Firestonebacteria bacterium]|nr:phage tail protein [Candidatus Firestonebacteria bacterium]